MMEPFWPQDTAQWLYLIVLFQTLVGLMWCIFKMPGHGDIWQPTALLLVAFMVGPIGIGVLGLSPAIGLAVDGLLVGVTAVGATT